MKNLEPEEKELLESYEKDEWKSTSDPESEMDRYRTYASTTFKKDERVNISLFQKDSTAIPKRVLEEGKPTRTSLQVRFTRMYGGD